MKRALHDVYIVSAVRTPVGKAPRGVFKHTRPDDLLAHVIQGALAKVPGMDPHKIDDVIVGCAMPEAEQGMNVARIGLLLAGLPDTVPGVTINRFCASGVESIAMGVDRIAAGRAEIVLAGGTESMSLVPMGGYHLSANPAYFGNKEQHVGIAYGMGITAEKVANEWQISREMQDEFALESHKRAVAATQAGEFQTEILPYNAVENKADIASGEIVTKTKKVTADEGPRADTSLEALANLQPVFSLKGTVTAGNASQMSDGAGMVLLMSEAAVKQHNVKPLARFCGYSVAGVPPDIMGIGPIKAIPKTLNQLGLRLDQIDWIELNEAFAAQSLAVINELHLDRAKVNPLGGAIALGHPLGATGAIRMATVVHALQRHRKKYGMVTMCIGTGMGAAAVVEAM